MSVDVSPVNAAKEIGNLQPSMFSLTEGLTVQAFIWAGVCDLRGLPFSQALNMQLESMARWSASPFQPNM
jgi:hypothetical protein